MKKRAAYLFVLLAFIYCNLSPGQIVVNNSAPYNTAQYLVNNVLMGQGVTATNVSSIGQALQRGFFNGTNSNIGLDSGIVMSSGDIIELMPGNFGADPGLQTTTPATIVNDLISVANSAFKMLGLSYTVSTFSPINDMCVIEFDFIPTGDTLQFRYVFSSDEYLSYVNTEYNDVFAFFLYGPGIIPTDNVNNSSQNLGADGNPDFSVYNLSGTNYYPENIAIVPNTSPGLPITISSVHPSLNSQYYIDNSANTTVGMNGFTTILTAKAIVQCGQKYHIRLAVADASDGALDTGVFLEGGSFTSSGSVSISPHPPNVLGGATNGADTALYEGCGPVLLTLVRSGGDTAQQSVFYISSSGTAISGVDYSTLPDSVVFMPGQDTLNISFIPFQDGSPESLESLVIDVTGIFCTSVSTTSISLTIEDAPDVQITLKDDTLTCLDDSLLVTAVATGIPPLQYQWNTGLNDTDSVIKVMPDVTTDYFVTVTDGCGLISKIDTVTITVINDTLSLFAENDTVSCISTTVQISVLVNSGMQPVTYLWSTGETTQTITVSPPATADYMVTVTDACGQDSAITSLTVVVLGAEVLVFANSASSVCPGDTMIIEAEPSGGYPPYTVWWDTAGVIIIDTLLIANPLATVTYTLYATDQCGIDTGVTAVTLNVTSYEPLVADAGPDDTLMCPGDVMVIKPSAYFGSGGYTFTWSGWTDTRDSLVINPDSTSSYILGVTDNCPTDTVYDTITVFIPTYPPLVLTASDSLIHSCPTERVNISANAVGGQGTYTYTWNHFAGTGDSMVVSPAASVNYTVVASDVCGNADTAVIAVSIVVPKADFEYDYQADNNIRFVNTSLLADSFFWNFGDEGTSYDKNPFYSYSKEEKYEVMLLVMTEYGCRDSITKEIYPPLEIWLPNAFTPNGDQKNDVFEIKGIGVRTFQIMIFDRWGDVIFESDNMSNSWDGKFSNGKLMKTDAYIYHIRATGINYQKFEKSGSIILIR